MSELLRLGDHGAVEKKLFKYFKGGIYKRLP